MKSTLIYVTVAAMRDAEWGLTPLGDTDDDPATDAERAWYHQGRAEAFAEVMTLLERET